jgi:integrase
MIGLKEITLHDFRRAFCLSQIQAKVPDIGVMCLMGHSSTQLIARYTKQNKEHLEMLYHSPVDED